MHCMSDIAECRMDIRCPVCARRIAICFDALAGTGIVPTTAIVCRECGAELNIEATVSIVVGTESRKDG